MSEVTITGDDETSVVEVFLDDAEESIEVIVSDPENTEVVEVEIPGLDGPQGPVGPQGAVGPRGPAGLDSSFSYIFNFASPVNTWLINHDLNTFAINVELFDAGGMEWKAAIRYLDENNVQVDWYYPMSGFARIFS